MSWNFSQVLVAEYLDQNCLDIELSAQLKSTHTLGAFYSLDKTMEPSTLSQYGMTLLRLMEGLGEALLKWWQEASRVRTSRGSEEVMALTVNDQACGLTWRGLLARFDPNTSSLKTAQCSLVEDLTESSLTLPKWGLMSNGDVYQHPLSALPIAENESGLLPTPLADDWKGGTDSIRKSNGKQRLDQFRHWLKAMHGLSYPIPAHSEAVMGWPIGMTALEPLETGKSLYAERLRGQC